jgi:hypothetical protein
VAPGSHNVWELQRDREPRRQGVCVLSGVAREVHARQSASSAPKITCVSYKSTCTATLYSAAAAGASASHIPFTAFAIAAILGPTMVSTTCPPCETSGADTVDVAG